MGIGDVIDDPARELGLTLIRKGFARRPVLAQLRAAAEAAASIPAAGEIMSALWLLVEHSQVRPPVSWSGPTTATRWPDSSAWAPRPACSTETGPPGSWLPPSGSGQPRRGSDNSLHHSLLGLLPSACITSSRNPAGGWHAAGRDTWQ